MCLECDAQEWSGVTKELELAQVYQVRDEVYFSMIESHWIILGIVIIQLGITVKINKGHLGHYTWDGSEWDKEGSRIPDRRLL